jgi:excisionase family DNA binding protein
MTKEEGRARDAPSCGSAGGSRLLSLQEAARYLGVSSWTVRDLVANGTLPRVTLPGGTARGSGLRRVLLDRRDLDRLIETNKSGPPRPP